MWWTSSVAHDWPRGHVHAIIRNPSAGGDLIDITPDLDGDSVALAVNELGMVVGSVGPIGEGTQSPFVWWPFTGFERLPLPQGEGITGAVAYDINDHGTILVHGISSAGFDNSSFLWNPRSRNYTQLLSPIPSLTAVGAKLDERDGVVGQAAALADGATYVEMRAVVWDPGTLAVHVLPGREPVSGATDWNEQGMIVGYEERNDKGRQAVYWSSLTEAPRVLGGQIALGVNNAGQIVGCRPSDTPPDMFTAVMWEPSRGRTVDLPGKDGGSCAYDINNKGQSAGEAGVPQTMGSSAGWWDAPAP